MVSAMVSLMETNVMVIANLQGFLALLLEGLLF